ncbi:hypothetical protein Y032_0030g2189 [Ancylostoma ceylanicum]|uniref:Uncharacterized protein n=1 Tax=Ancylostoma ceylanicum TaxID=53326 RepID=A0A016US60_9BILA|nr:hypothetical protein Y032_0030g2189 [Ancylostoma ceylanicum]
MGRKIPLPCHIFEKSGKIASAIFQTPQQPPSCVLQTDLRLSAPKSAIFRHFVGKPCTQPGCCLAFAELHEQHLVFVTSLVVVMSS